MKRTFIFLIAVLISAPYAFAGGPAMKPGKWEITSQVDMPGMLFKVPAQTYTQCISPQDVKNPQKTTPSGPKNCEVKDYKMAGNTATWQVVCKNGSTMDGEIKYSGTSYSGKMVTNTGGRTITTKFSGKRIGNCQ